MLRVAFALLVLWHLGWFALVDAAVCSGVPLGLSEFLGFSRQASWFRCLGSGAVCSAPFVCLARVCGGLFDPRWVVSPLAFGTIFRSPVPSDHLYFTSACRSSRPVGSWGVPFVWSVVGGSSPCLKSAVAFLPCFFRPLSECYSVSCNVVGLFRLLLLAWGCSSSTHVALVQVGWASS